MHPIQLQHIIIVMIKSHATCKMMSPKQLKILNLIWNFVFHTWLCYSEKSFAKLISQFLFLKLSRRQKIMMRDNLHYVHIM